jgi:predicted transcriptional regulator
VSNAPKTPQRTIRICDEDWLAAQAIAKQRGEDASAVLRAALERYVKRNQKKMTTWHDSTGTA